MLRKFRQFGTALGVLAGIVALGPVSMSGQNDSAHDHTAAISGVPHGIPYFCASPTVTSRAPGLWSDPKTWSTGKLPGAREVVLPRVRSCRRHT